MALVCWLCLAQLCLPLLGKLHDISHPPTKAAAAVVLQDAAAERVSSDGMTSSGHGVHDLFGKHSEADCQGFSHMAMGAGLLSHDLQAAMLGAVQEAAPTVLAILLRQSPALFFARGPPLSHPSLFQ